MIINSQKKRTKHQAQPLLFFSEPRVLTSLFRFRLRPSLRLVRILRLLLLYQVVADPNVLYTSVKVEPDLGAALAPVETYDLPGEPVIEFPGKAHSIALLHGFHDAELAVHIAEHPREGQISAAQFISVLPHAQNPEHARELEHVTERLHRIICI